MMHALRGKISLKIQDISFVVDLDKDVALRLHTTIELVLKTCPEGTSRANPNASQRIQPP
ncbi:hypothetical protein D8674_010608 [Pyrus ussuriensis x Pyrus communis]|uniref:Uncharacterized protein n=1 Tax=Pyrus ussuriensis x Pyrus communis TaxID=2448454 RepID=A0A5N5FBI9_9ROSA|nr:hypothetical protein D8674_010608 [Pyrus ussuriensis x Pyrus communis]